MRPLRIFEETPGDLVFGLPWCVVPPTLDRGLHVLVSQLLQQLDRFETKFAGLKVCMLDVYVILRLFCHSLFQVVDLDICLAFIVINVYIIEPRHLISNNVAF